MSSLVRLLKEGIARAEVQRQTRKNSPIILDVPFCQFHARVGDRIDRALLEEVDATLKENC